MLACDTHSSLCESENSSPSLLLSKAFLLLLLLLKMKYNIYIYQLHDIYSVIHLFSRAMPDDSVSFSRFVQKKDVRADSFCFVERSLCSVFLG